METTSRTRLQVIYDGPALSGGTMEISDLAPALLGIAELCQRANALMNPYGERLSVRASADLKSGSFHVDLDLEQLVSATMPMLAQSMSHLKDAKDIADTLFSGDHSVSGIVKFLRGRDPRTLTSTSSSDERITINAGNNNTIVINQDSWTIANDATARKALQKATSPLMQPGIDKLTIGNSDSAIEVSKSEARFFAELPRKNMTEESRLDILEIVSFDFERGKSKFTDGEATFSASIVDEVFWQAVEDRTYGIRKGDVFEVELTVKRTRGIRLSTEYTIVRVLNVQQLKTGEIPGDDNSAETLAEELDAG